MPSQPTRETYLATLKITPYLPRMGARYVLHTWDGEHTDPHYGHKDAIGYRLIRIAPNGERETVFSSEEDGYLYQPRTDAIDSPKAIADAQASILNFYAVGMDEEGDYHEPEDSEILMIEAEELRVNAGIEEPEGSYDPTGRTAAHFVDGRWYQVAVYDAGFLDYGVRLQRWQSDANGQGWFCLGSNPCYLSRESWGADWEDENGQELEEGKPWDVGRWRCVMHYQGAGLVEDLIDLFTGGDPTV